MENTKVKSLLLMKGSVGKKVKVLKDALAKALGESLHGYELDKGEVFDIATETALRAWQASVGLVPDGIAGPRTMSALGVAAEHELDVRVDVASVCTLFPYTKSSNISKNLPYVTAALAAFGLTNPQMIGVALGTIRAETEGFVPIAEMPSHFNTLPGQAPFSAYDNRRNIGNTRVGDGARYKGRGFVQLTGRANYENFGSLLDIPLAENPDLGCAPEIAACLLAAFLASKEKTITEGLATEDLKKIRRAVNGGSHGLDRFTDTFVKASELWGKARPRVMMAGEMAGEETLTAAQQRAASNVSSDPADLRDRPYTPPPRSLPEIYPDNADVKKFIGAYSKAGLILNQGREGACTGFGLACVINYLRWRASGAPGQFESVSPRMLYHFARRYDEYEGENYEGSSCRGALKGWFHNGVCLDSRWPYHPGDNSSLPLSGWDTDAAERTLGVYYRISTKAITDLQAAIHEVGAIYVSAYTHKGWETVGNTASPPSSHAGLPVITYNGVPSRKGGHAFALVGFNRKGFVIQNSWGTRWGAAGFALITYEDWLAHAMDAWVAAMGVPGVISGRLSSPKAAAGTTAAEGKVPESWWNEATAYQHSIVFGNNGRVERFDQVDGLTRTLQNQACVLPDSWFRNSQHKKKRLVIYAHGGLNSEESAIKRAQAMGRYFIGNGCYPLFLVWKSGLLESIGNILADKMYKGDDTRAQGFGDWLSDSVSDPLIEKTIGRPFARPLWSEMKENAILASESGRGGDLLVSALKSLAGSWGDNFELHLMGHSAGSIILGRLLDLFARQELIDKVASVHLYAPACTVAFANRHYAPQTKIMKNLYLDILSDAREQDDQVAQIYRKSLLYFVSNALEADHRMPILGMANVFNQQYSGWDGSSFTGETLSNWLNAVEICRLEKRLTIHDEQTIQTRLGNGSSMSPKIEKASHGGFDNNINVVEKSLKRITGSTELNLPVEDLVGF
ncbi:peptidoglycan-binding protein [Desulfopila aestuarii]|uniref:Predicted chitinase n=1 Tax=Desulfopila aestuarii DSM 18488 TaxID=1121416 RepID=A0A1M7Y3K3_9BACT|nr:peptidoglycan-binding protein [Desulfopila aestuarii]SHO46778.1 Predicted chitinase [Desulfopila aestuarii DSM 18488]